MEQNSVVVAGNLTHDPELNVSDNGRARTRFSIACNRSYKQNDEWVKTTSYFDVIVWGAMAEPAADELEKGMPVIVSGRLEQNSWEDSEGNTRKQIRIVASKIGKDILSSLRNENGNNNQNNRARNNQSQASNNRRNSQTRNRSNRDDFANIQDEPF